MGIEPSSLLQTRKLLIPRADKNYKNDRNTEVRYTAGTWDITCPAFACARRNYLIKER